MEFIRRGHFAEGSVPTPVWTRLVPLAEPASPPDDATVDRIKRVQLPKWYAWYGAAFLFGAATGGLLFGWWHHHLPPEARSLAQALNHPHRGIQLNLQPLL